MASSPAKFLIALLAFAAVGWVVFIFAARLLAWFLSRVLKASVEFRVAGCNCLRDITLKFEKGAVESLSVGEIKLSLRKSLVKLGFSFISGDPKLQFVICDLDVVVRPTEKSIKRSKPKSTRKSSPGKGKWMLVTNISRFLSVSVTELVVKAPDASIEIKDLRLDISKDGGPNPVLFIKLFVNPLLVQVFDSPSFDHSGFDQGDFSTSLQSCSLIMDRDSTPFMWDSLSLSCEFGHEKEGIIVKNVDLQSGDITINLNETLFVRTKKKSDASTSANVREGATLDVSAAQNPQVNKLSSLLRRHVIPEKVSFNLPKLDVKFRHLGQDLTVENNVMGIQLRCCKSTACEESGETTPHFDIQMEFSEIHLIREGTKSILEILKVAVIGSIDVPVQPLQPIRAEVDVKLGGTQCNVMINRLTPWLRLHSSKKKAIVLRDESSHKERSQNQTSKLKTIMWTCTLSAPEMTIVVHSLNELPLYHVCSQSSHLFANNIANKGIQVHGELGELHLHMADDYQKCLKESLFSVEINSGSLVHIARVSLDWGHREVDSSEGSDPNKMKLIFSIDVTGMEVNFGFKHVESLISTMLSFKALLKSVSGSTKRAPQSKVVRSSKTPSKGTQILKLNLDKCSVNYCGDITTEDRIIADPKRVNYGSQGGEQIISVSADGTPRTASVTSTAPSDCKKIKFTASLNISHLNLTLNKEKHSLQIDLERARSIYQEYLEENNPSAKVTLLDIQNAKFVRRSGGINEIAVCSLINVTDIAVRWEPDIQLAVIIFMTSLKSVVQNQKNQLSDVNEIKDESANIQNIEPEKEVTHSKKKESIFAIDVEKLQVSAELADGVEAMIHVQSIFSENARIGVLLEELVLSFNENRIFRSSRMQISRIPVSVTTNSIDSKAQSTTTWDLVIQGPDVYICLPYRLELRAIDDAVEDTLRGLKLIAAAKTSLLVPKKGNTNKPKHKSTVFGSVRLIIRRLMVDIEEEPIQGWFDEHYKLMKNEVCELGVRLKFLDEVVSGSKSGVSDTSVPSSERKFLYNGVEIDFSDKSAIKDLQDEIHRHAFQSYYQACQRLKLPEGSGACLSGFQSGFKPSTKRASLLTVSATELDVTLTKIEGGNVGMVEFINKVDPVSLEDEIPFSKMYGRDISLRAGTLTAQIRDYTFPLFAAEVGECQGRLVLAQQSTFFQPQIPQDVCIGRWWKVRMLRSASGTTPAVKTYMDLPLYFQKAELSYGVGYEPVFADISYVFTVAMRRAILGTKGNNSQANQPPKKERSLPWWDDMRYYIHGKVGLHFNETEWNLLATTDPYEKLDKLNIVTGYMEILQSDGHVSLSTKEFKAYLSSLVSLVKNCSLKLPCTGGPFIYCPALSIDVGMIWECDSGSPLNHYLHALPREGKQREKVLDPFRSTSLAFRWDISLKPSSLMKDEPSSASGIGDSGSLDRSLHESSHKLESAAVDSPTVNLGAYDLLWLFKWWNMVNLPPNKLRTFSRWPRFGVPRVVRSGNLPLDKIMTEFFLRLVATPTWIKHTPLGDDDPASGLTFKIAKLKLELCNGRGKQKFTFESKRDPLDLCYQGLDLHFLKIYLNRNAGTSVAQDLQLTKGSQSSTDKFNNEKPNYLSGSTEKCHDDGFFLYSDYFTIRKQTPKADGAKILAWQEAARKNPEMTFVRSEFGNGSESDHARSDLSDDDGFNVVVADNCQRVFVYGLKLLWTIENRDAVWSWVGGISKAFQPPKPSPSQQYSQRKLLEEQKSVEEGEGSVEDAFKSSPSTLHGPHGTSSPLPQHGEPLGVPLSVSPKVECSSNVVVNPRENGDSEEEGTRHFMVSVVQPQFNLHSEEANGRFLLAAASGRILARSFHSVLHVGYDMIEQALGTSNISIPETEPEMTWKRVELSVMLEQVQAHVAPTDVDPGAGLQWLPKILRSSPEVKRTGALLERVFTPCQMYFRYTRHKGGTPELKVKPLKELKFNSPNIQAAMTSRQFQVMLDVLTNLLFARLPKPRKNSLPYPTDDDEDVEEEADEMVPDGVEEVELARISIEEKERERKLILDDIKALSVTSDTPVESVCPENDGELWMITGGQSTLVNGLKKDLGSIQTSRKAAYSALRMALQKAAQLRLMEKEKNKSPSYAMRISMRISKVVWSMLADDKAFVEAEINDMIYDFDRDYKDIGVAEFTTKSFVLRNCLPNAKSDMLLSAWNPPPEWGKNVMLRVNAKQGAPKDENSLLELFQVDIYPLKIHLTESMYRMMWEYFFPEEEQDSQRRQEVWKVSTTAGARRVRKSDATASSSQSTTKHSDHPKKSGANSTSSVSAGNSTHGDSSQLMKLPKVKGNNVVGSTPELRRTSSFDRSWEETVAESVANEIVLQLHSSNISTKSGPLNSASDHQPAVGVGEETSKSKTKDSKPVKTGRLSHEEKKAGKAHDEKGKAQDEKGKGQDEKRAKPKKMMEFHNIKISQVELLVTYEGSRFAVGDLRLLMDAFHRDDFTGTWRRLFSRVKKHIIWGVLKSVTGMQGKKFKDKAHNQKEAVVGVVPETELNFSDSDSGQPGKSDQFPITFATRPTDGAGDGFVSSVKGLFSTQRRKAKAFVLRTMRGEGENEFQGEWSESDAEFSPFARQLTITKAKKLIRRHTRKFRSRARKNPDFNALEEQPDSHPSSPRDISPFGSDSSGGSSCEEFNE